MHGAKSVLESNLNSFADDRATAGLVADTLADLVGDTKCLQGAKSVLEGYPTSIADDRALLQSGQLAKSSREEMAVKVGPAYPVLPEL